MAALRTAGMGEPRFKSLMGSKREKTSEREILAEALRVDLLGTPGVLCPPSAETAETAEAAEAGTPESGAGTGKCAENAMNLRTSLKLDVQSS